MEANKKIIDNPLEKVKLKNFDRCICGRLLDSSQMIIECSEEDCSCSFHHKCMPWKKSDIKFFKCPKCILLTNDPLHKVESILYEPSILVNEQKFGFKVEIDQLKRMRQDPSVGVEIRSLKLDGRHFFEQTWPDKAVMRVNNNPIKEFKPLHQNSSLKKRRDEKFFNRTLWKTGSNYLQMIFENIKDGKNTKAGEDPFYVFTVLLIRKLNIQELSNQILTNNKLSIQQSKKFIMEKFSEYPDLEISEIKVDLLCKITYTLMDIPARGVMCTHIDCFSLKFYIQSMQVNSMRKWVCPVCRKMSSSLIVDGYLMEILEEVRKSENDWEKVYFLRDGSYKFTKTSFDKTLKDAGEENYVPRQLDQNFKEKEVDMEVLSITSMEEEGGGGDERGDEDGARDGNGEGEEERGNINEEGGRGDGNADGETQGQEVGPQEAESRIQEEVNSGGNDQIITQNEPETQAYDNQNQNPEDTQNIGEAREDANVASNPENSSTNDPGQIIISSPSARANETEMAIEGPEGPENPQSQPQTINKDQINQRTDQKTISKSKSQEKRISQRLRTENKNTADIRFDEYSPITIQTPHHPRSHNPTDPTASLGHDFATIGRREAPILDQVRNTQIKQNSEVWDNINFLKNYWSHFQKKKKSINIQPQSFKDFKQNLQKLKENDYIFKKQFELLFKIVENRKNEINNPIIQRYNRIIKDLDNQNYLFNDRNCEDLGRKRIKRGKRNKPKGDCIQEVLSEFGLDKEDSSLVSMKRRRKGLPMRIEGSSLNNIIEII